MLKASLQGECDDDEPTSVLFKDSLSFLGSSLANVTDMAVRSKKSFNIVKQSLLCRSKTQFDSKKFELLLKKGLFFISSLLQSYICRNVSLRPNAVPQRYDDE